MKFFKQHKALELWLTMYYGKTIVHLYNGKEIGTLEKLFYYTENYVTLIYCGKNKSTVEETIVNYGKL